MNSCTCGAFIRDHDYHETSCAVFVAETPVASQTYRVLADVATERLRQEQLKAAGRFEFTAADYPGLADTEKLAMLAEEVGEVARCIQERAGNVNDGGEKPSRDDLRTEVIQCAAIATAWAEALS